MRFVILGAGAVGGVVGARLHQSGHDVILIARGAHHDAIRAAGLRFETPQEQLTLRIPVAATASAAGLDSTRDLVLLCTKSQDTWSALEAVRAAAGRRLPVACLQNGVENERVAARLFDEVLGAVVLLPCAHLEPGVVQAFGAEVTGSIDVGRYPGGTGALTRALCRALAASRIESVAREEIMRFKHQKLLTNLGNAVQAVCGPEVDAAELRARLVDEGRAVLRAAGIDVDETSDIAAVRARWERWGVGEIAGRARGGGSTWQSVVRGTGHVETDYLNGEIVLRARQAGVPAPANRLLQELVHEAVRERRPPGWITPEQVLARLEAG